MLCFSGHVERVWVFSGLWGMCVCLFFEFCEMYGFVCFLFYVDYAGAFIFWIIKNVNVHLRNLYQTK